MSSQLISGRSLGRIAGIVISLAFFLPWVSACDVQASGLDIASARYGQGKSLYWLILLGGLFCLALPSIAGRMAGSTAAKEAVARLIAGVVGLLLMLDLALSVRQDTYGVVKVLLGAYLTALGYLVVLWSAWIDLRQPSSSGAPPSAPPPPDQAASPPPASPDT